MKLVKIELALWFVLIAATLAGCVKRPMVYVDGYPQATDDCMTDGCLSEYMPNYDGVPSVVELH